MDADDDYDDEEEIEAEAQLFGEDGADPAAAQQEQYEQQVRGQIWGSAAGSDDGSRAASEPGDSASRAGDPNAPAYYMPPRARRGGGASHWAGGRGSDAGGSQADSDARAAGGPVNQGGYGGNGAHHIPVHAECHVRHMPGFSDRELNGAALLGAGVQMKAPLFCQGNTNASGWVNYALSGVANAVVPVRTMCFNIPSECFSTDASKFTDWQTPMENSIRVAAVAAIIGLVSTPLSKGFLSGNHEEVARADADAGDGDGQQRGGDVKKPKRVTWHMFQSEEDRYQNLPQVVIGYEDIYNAARDTVKAIRIWHFVFDKAHSTSHIARCLMNESADEADHSGAAHCPNHLRKMSAVAAAKQSRGLVGASLETAQLEVAAGMCYRHVVNESVYKNLLAHYAGHSDKSPGLPPVDLSRLPQGVLNSHLLPAEELGCTHPLAFEWVFNAKRPDALKAGLVHLDGTEMDIDPDQIMVTSYFDVSAPANDDDSHVFRVPSWVGSAANGGKGCFFFQTDPHQQNIFDMTLPHTIAGSIKPGRELMSLYKEQFASDREMPVESPELLNLFNNTMTGRDQWMSAQINALKDSIINYDTVDTTPEQRMDVKTAKKAAMRGIASYGQTDADGSHVIEPRQVLKEHAFTTSNVHSKLIAPWASKQRVQFTDQEVELRSANDKEHAQTPFSHAHFKLLREEKEQFEERHQNCMQELIQLHLSKMERSFNSKIDKESIPAGYRAVWDGLQRELKDMPDGTANIAFALDMQLTDSDRTLFGHMMNWLGVFFEDDCFVDGRDWRLMQELFFHCFEQFGEQTLLLIFCGPKGNGKTLRTERAMKAFVEGWMVMSGPSSTKAGMQGNSDSSNGCNCVYDEMIDELTDSDGSNRTEYWKMILLKREYVYNKPVVVKGADGREMHKTFKLRTPHQETHCVCTNRGPAFTKGQEDPSEVKSALIDRATVHFVRTLGQRTHDDQEFEAHMQHTEVKRKLKMFRIMTCLMGLTKMLIFRQPYLKPDMAMAQKLWDKWDERLDRKYGLPKSSPRKNIKRLENLVTMCCLNAVGHVFVFKETAHKFPAGQTTPEYPKGKPFELSMLSQVISMLQPTREMIHLAWTMGLEYNIGTSAMGLNTLTIVAETCGKQPGDWFNLPPAEEYASYLQEESEITDLQAEHEAAGGGRSVARVHRQLNPDSLRLPELDRIFEKSTDTMTEVDIKRKKNQLEAKRTARSEYQYMCSRSELQNLLMKDAENIVDEALGDSVRVMSLEPLPHPLPRGNAAQAAPVGGGDQPMTDADADALMQGPRREGEEGPPAPVEDSVSEEDLSYDEMGRRMYERDQSPSELSPSDPVLMAFHRARAHDFPGADNCQLMHNAIPAHQRLCPYCCTTLAEAEEAQSLAAAANPDATGATGAATAERTQLSLACSHLWPDVLESAMFYKPQTLVQFAAGKAAYIDPAGSVTLGTKPCGPFTYKQKNMMSGASRMDIGWLQGKAEHFKTWHRTAEYIRNRGSRTVMEFDFHVDGLRDCLYLCSTRDNARRCPEEPRLPMNSRPERALKDAAGNVIKDSTVCVQVSDYRHPAQKTSAYLDKEHLHVERDPAAAVPNTDLQRRIDSMLHGGRLSALNVLVSNKVISTPPIRMHTDGIEVNVGAIHNHVMLVAESICACALVPGLRNMQEVFCNNQPGPDGLSAPPSKEKAVGKKRTADHEPKADAVHTLPYSYDVVGLALAMDTAMMLYDDLGTKWAQSSTVKYQEAFGLELEFEQLPHLSLRYIGYEESNRQTVSLKLPAEKPEGQEYEEAGDPDQKKALITSAHVERSLGRKATSDDIIKYISRRQGARSMGGVTGDLFAASTWFKHTVATLRERGLIRGQPSEPEVQAYADMEQCIQARVVEHASEAEDERYKEMNMFVARPGTYSAIAEAAAVEEEEAAGPPVQQMRRQVNDLSFDVLDMDWGVAAPAARPQRAPGVVGRAAVVGIGPAPMEI